MSMKKFFYRVENDSVLSLSEKFGVPPTVIIKENRLKREIARGDVLLITLQDGKRYAVQPTDTLKKVAARFGVSEKELCEKNGVDYLFYGLTLLI